MYPALMRDFNDDFYSAPMDNMRRMESMMDSMMGGMFPPMGMGLGMGMGMGMMPQPQLADTRHGMNNNNSLMPFGFGRSLFPSMDMFGNLAQNPNCHSFSSSSVMSYTTDETGRPQVYQHTASTRTAPGGVKETRETLQDSRSGLQKMAIGHHMDDKAHVVEKKKYKYTGEEEENHEYINLEEDEADQFNSEWQQRAQPYQPRQPGLARINYQQPSWRQRSPEPEVLAITDGSQTSPAENHAALHKKKGGLLKKKGKNYSPNRKPGRKSHE